MKHFLHFTYNSETIEDKSNPAYDRTFKFRPIIDYFDTIKTTILLARDFSIDEKTLLETIESTLEISFRVYRALII